MPQLALSQALGGSTINIEVCRPGLLFTNKRKHPSLYKHSSISPITAPDGAPLQHGLFLSTNPLSLYTHTAVHSTALTLTRAFCPSFKRRPVQVISRSQFKWTVCVTIGGHWNVSPHFFCRGPAGWSPCS